MSDKSALRNSSSAIAIVGAGPAGTSAAIRLARRGFSVTLIEREKFPRHKLCGEFVSPECLAHFRELGVYEEMLAVGGEQISKTIFYEPRGHSFEIPSAWFGRDEAALGISRSAMDYSLLKRARETGVEVIEESRAVGLTFENQKLTGVKIKSADGKTREIFADLIVDATGRSRILSKLLEKNFAHENPLGQKSKPEYVAFKTHFSHVNFPRGACEIYFFRGGYGGLNFVEGGAANHCFIVKAEGFRKNDGDADAFFRDVILSNVRARETMRDASRLFEWQAVAIENFGFQKSNPLPNLLCIGDAVAFIDPFTGSGILMALESSELIEKAVTSCDRVNEVARGYARLHRAKFRTRIRVCGFWRRAAFSPHFVSAGVKLLGNPAFPRKWLTETMRPRGFQPG